MEETKSSINSNLNNRPITACERCGKFLYDENEIYRRNEKVKRNYRGEHIEENKVHFYCKRCYDEEEKRIDKIKKQRFEEKKRKGKRLTWLNYFAGLLFGVFVGFVLYYTLKVNNYEYYLLISIVFGILAFFAMGNFVLGNNILVFIAGGIIRIGVKLPFGIIFSGLGELILFRILFFILEVFVAVFSILLAVAICGGIGIFMYPYALYKAYKYPWLCWEIEF